MHWILRGLLAIVAGGAGAVAGIWLLGRSARKGYFACQSFWRSADGTVIDFSMLASMSEGQMAQLIRSGGEFASRCRTIFGDMSMSFFASTSVIPTMFVVVPVAVFAALALLATRRTNRSR